MKPIVSVIIPVYNSQKTIRRCIESLLSQTLSNFVIYIVDDGSIDNTLKIIEKFVHDNRIHVSTQRNKGVSVARNRGLKQVRTKYVTFVDSDDYVSPRYLERLVGGIENKSVNMAICNIPSDFFNLTENKLVKSDIVMNMLLLPNGMGGYLWNKVFESQIIFENKIVFNEKLFIAEDLVFCERYLSHTNQVNLLPTSDYYYNISCDSISNNINFRKNNIEFYMNYLCAFKYMLNFSLRVSNDFNQNIRARMCDLCCDIIRMINLNNDTEKINIKIKLKKIISENRSAFFKSRVINSRRKILLVLLTLFPALIKVIDKIKN